MHLYTVLAFGCVTVLYAVAVYWSRDMMSSMSLDPSNNHESNNNQFSNHHHQESHDQLSTAEALRKICASNALRIAKHIRCGNKKEHIETRCYSKYTSLYEDIADVVSTFQKLSVQELSSIEYYLLICEHDHEDIDHHTHGLDAKSLFYARSLEMCRACQSNSFCEELREILAEHLSYSYEGKHLFNIIS